MTTREEIVNALADLYSDTSDIRNVLNNANIDDTKINLNGAASAVWSNILIYTDARGESTSTLLMSIAKADPTFQPLGSSYVAQLYQRPTLGHLSKALDALWLTDANLNKHEVRLVMEGYKSRLDKVGGQLELLRSYKSIHDELQRFQFPVIDYPSLETAISSFEGDDNSGIELRSFFDLLEKLCNTLSILIDGLPAGNVRNDELNWFTDLDVCQKRFGLALQTGARGQLVADLEELKGPLRFIPTRIDGKIFQTAGRLELQDLADAFGKMSEITQVSADEQKRLRDAKEATLNLSEIITKLVSQHQDWQTLDGRLADLGDLVQLSVRIADNASIIPAFGRLWKGIKFQLDQLKRLDPAGSWRAPIEFSARNVDDLLATERVSTRLNEVFSAFREEALQYFVEVDISLLAECNSMTEINKPLDKIVGRL
jgi:hypothetical protein